MSRIEALTNTSAVTLPSNAEIAHARADLDAVATDPGAQLSPGAVVSRRTGLSKEVQRLICRADTIRPYRCFTLSFEGRTTRVLPSQAQASDVEAALEALPNVGDVQVLINGSIPRSAQFGGGCFQPWNSQESFDLRCTGRGDDAPSCCVPPSDSSNLRGPAFEACVQDDRLNRGESFFNFIDITFLDVASCPASSPATTRCNLAPLVVNFVNFDGPNCSNPLIGEDLNGASGRMAEPARLPRRGPP